MELQSDFNKISYLLQTEELTDIGFEDEDDVRETQFGGDKGKLDEYEKEIHAIFAKAREYRQRVMEVQSRLSGGADDTEKSAKPEKKKRPPNKILEGLIQLSHILKKSGKYLDIQWKHLMKISNIIWQAAKNKAHSDDPGKILSISLELVKNPDMYVAEYRNQEKTSKKTDTLSSTARSSRVKRPVRRFF